MTLFIDDRFMAVSECDGIITLQWKKETTHLTDADFKDEASQFIDIVKKSRSRRILVDMRDFGYALSPELIAWRNENVIAIYNEIGVERFAFVSSKPAVHQDNTVNKFITQQLTTVEEARDWLLRKI